ncbi:MAG TPA: GspE/PulE family protein [Xanthomonadaceae bacterium]|nr:GspE/PulE family protein [Xanthomonadaceae bacterium]
MSKPFPSESLSDGMIVLNSSTHLEAFLQSAALGESESRLDHLRSDLADVEAAQQIPLARLEACRRLGIPLLDVERVHAEAEAVALMTPARARELRAIPLCMRGALIAVGMENPTDAEALTALGFMASRRAVPVLLHPVVLRQAIADHYDRVEDIAVARQLGLDPNRLGVETSEHDAERLAAEKPVVRIVSQMISEAARRRASDIHLRPSEEGADLLFRIDDEMVPVRRFLRALVPAIVSRIKVLANMNLAEHRRPQDGRTSFTLDDGRSIDLRMSVLPAIFGESVVVRLLDTQESLKSLDEIGFTEKDRHLVDDLMNRSHGMFLATGPTGCGKSTTLYAMLLELRKQRINVLTIEEPVEFYIDDIQQMQVNRAVNFTFASAMRNFLRHDPDVIMVGEIRDRETADIAVESALTGHLLLSTLHTNTAAATITRMLDLGVEAYLLRASLLGVLAQRLVRLTCPHCKEEEKAPEWMRETLEVKAKEVFYVGRGCRHCDGLGIRKRAAVYELLEVTPEIRHLIVPGAEADRIHEKALELGMRSLTQSAVAMAREGRISLAEAYRVRSD